jgi:hypothetical protein
MLPPYLAQSTATSGGEQARRGTGPRKGVFLGFGLQPQFDQPTATIVGIGATNALDPALTAKGPPVHAGGPIIQVEVFGAVSSDRERGQVRLDRERLLTDAPSGWRPAGRIHHTL